MKYWVWFSTSVMEMVAQRCIWLCAIVIYLMPGLALPAAAQDARCTVEINRWAIHLDAITVDGIRNAAADLIIIDPTRNGDPEDSFHPRDVEAMKTGSDGKRRLVLAYLSTSQAEDYRRYWQDGWSETPPEWLDVADNKWPDNYEVQYWDADWQKLVFGQPDAMLDRLIATGFDGVMLDGVDAFETWADRRATAADDMIRFVGRLAHHARTQDPGFLLLALNAENLLTDTRFAAMIDGIVKEDLFYGLGHIPNPNPPEAVNWAREKLTLARQLGIPVFILEYLPAGHKRRSAAELIDAAGFLGSFAKRPLDSLSEPHPAPGDAITGFANGAACRQGR